MLFIPVKFCKFAFCQQFGISPLAQNFVYADGDGIREIQAAGVRIVYHRYSHAAVRVVVQKLLGQSLCLLAEDYVCVVGINYIRMDVLRFG